VLEKPQDLDERQLIPRICAGEHAAFQCLIEMYHQIIWHTICVLVPGRVAAEDILQEVWIDVWRGLPGFQREKAFRPWLLRVVTNRCRKSSRRVFPFNQPLDMVEPEQLVAPDDLLEHLLHQETYQEIQDLLRELPLEQQRVLALRYFAELELAEIALVMGTSIGTVKSRLHRALSRLRLHMQPVSMTKGV